jgi:hypothetical protein
MMISPIAAWYAQQRHHVFRVRTFGKTREAAQIAKECGNLSTMAFELLLAARRDDQVGDLRRQEAPQPSHLFYFAFLVGDALFELLVTRGRLHARLITD